MHHHKIIWQPILFQNICKITCILCSIFICLLGIVTLFISKREKNQLVEFQCTDLWHERLIDIRKSEKKMSILIENWNHVKSETLYTDLGQETYKQNDSIKIMMQSNSKYSITLRILSTPVKNHLIIKKYHL